MPNQPNMPNIMKTSRPLLVACGFLAFGLSSCAETNSLMGNHLDAAQKYHAAAQRIEKSANEQSVILNHLAAANKYALAGQTRLKSASEYGELGNPTQEKNQYQKASEDFSNAAHESLSAEGSSP
ncbi:MAG: hypothetical protein ACYC9S_00555 [Leptospirales bacterium]